jgi:hypothetical protein
MSTITKDTVWFQVSRTARAQGQGHAGGDWMISKRTPSSLHQSRPSHSWGGDFDTRAEAIAHGQGQGWIQVNKWAEAKAQARPYYQEMELRRDAFAKARAGLREVRIQRGDGKYSTRYLDANRAEALLAFLGEVDEFGVIR